MSLIGYLILALAKIARLGTTLYTYIIIGSVVVNWVGADPYNPIVRFLKNATEPVYAWIRKHLLRNKLFGPIDFTPFVTLLLVILLETIVINSLFDLADTFLK